MKVLHVNAGGEIGGGKTHIVSLVSALGTDTAELLVFEEGPVAAAAREAGCRVHVLGQTSRYDLSVLHRLRIFLNEGAYDLIHTHGARANFMLSLVADYIKAKWLVTVHSDPYLEFQERGIGGKIFQRLNVRSVRRADHVIAVSEALKKQLQAAGTDSEKISVVHNGIVFGPPQEKRLQNSRFTMVHVARLHPVKGHRLLFQSLKKADLPRWQLQLVGDGEWRSELEKEVRVLDLEQHVHFLGWLDPKAVRETVRSADVSLLASLSETFPLVLLESANEGTPFITTDVGDVAQLVPDPSYGWLVEPEEPDALAEALEEAYSDWEAGALPAKGQRIYERTKRLFSLEQMAVRTRSVYAEVLPE